MPLVYPHSREIAAAHLRKEKKPMQATSLVHEVYLRLIAQRKAEWKDRAHLYTFASKIMRLILIDQARTNQAQRRGSNAVHVPLSEDLPWVGPGSPELIDLDQALQELCDLEPPLVRTFELRYFLGCTTGEIAEISGGLRSNREARLEICQDVAVSAHSSIRNPGPSKAVSRYLSVFRSPVKFFIHRGTVLPAVAPIGYNSRKKWQRVHAMFDEVQAASPDQRSPMLNQLREVDAGQRSDLEDKRTILCSTIKLGDALTRARNYGSSDV